MLSEDDNPYAKINLRIVLPFIIVFFIYLIVGSLWYYKKTLIVKYGLRNFEIYNFLFYICFYLAFLFLLKSRKIGYFEFLNSSKEKVISVMIICALLISTYMIVILLIDDIAVLNIDGHIRKELDNLNYIEKAIFLSNTIILAPLVEETLFRGLLYFALYKNVGRVLAIIVTSLLFFETHLGAVYSNVFGASVILIKSFIFTIIFDKTKSIIYPLGLHISFNIQSTLALFA